MRTIDSGQVAAFLKENKKASVQVPVLRMLNAALELEYETEQVEVYLCHVRNGDEVFDFSTDRTLTEEVTVAWEQVVSDDGLTLVQKPFAASDSLDEDVSETEFALALRMGFEPVEVSCPERIVTLPCPSWLRFTDEVHTPRYFASELNVPEVRAFITQLEAILQSANLEG